MNRTARSMVAGLMAAWLGLPGCASYADKNVAYRESRESPVLTIPEGLDAPDHERPLTIPAAGALAGDEEPLDVSAPNILEETPPAP